MSAVADTRALFESQAEELRGELATVLRALGRAEGLFGGATRAMAQALGDLPALAAPEALAEWGFALGVDGVLGELARRIERGAGVERMRVWMRAHDVCAELVELVALAQRQGPAAKAAA